MKRTLTFMVGLIAVTTSLLSQAPTASIGGVVSDSSGSAVPGARLVLVNEDTGQQFATTSNTSGDYLVGTLAHGRYSVTAEKDGFKKLSRQGISVTAMQNVRVDLKLELGALAQSIVVTGEAPLVDTRSSASGTLIDDRRIVDLPLNGRNVATFASLVPGVSRVGTANTVSSGQQVINVNGNRAYSTNMQLDGGMMYFPQRGQGLLPPPPDAIQEIRVITSGVTAEYGRGTAVFSMVTRSGTNEVHGSMWDYFRNDKLDSRSFFDSAKAKLRYNQFGGTVGGPIIKNKLFYFGSYQGLRIRQDASSNSAFPPTEAERRGDFSSSNPAPNDPLNNQPFPNRLIPASRIDPVVAKLLPKIPGPTDLSTGRLSARESSPTSGDDVVGKFDYTASQSDRISFRWYFDYLRGLNAFPSDIPKYSPAPNSQDVKSMTLTHNRTWTPRLITTTRGTFTRFVYNEFNAKTDSFQDLGVQNFVDGGGPPRLPRVIVSGRFTAAPTKDQERAGSNYDFAQDWSWQRGSHEVKWGAQVQTIGYAQFTDTWSVGEYTFDGSLTRNAMADFMLGRMVRFVQNSMIRIDGRVYIPGFYLQDNWKANRRLTLNLGLRWEVYTPWRDALGQMATFIPGAQSRTFPTAPRGLIYQTDPEYNYNTDYRNIGPRVGFAWDVFGDGRTAVRGGYAVSYDGVVSDKQLVSNQPMVLNVTNNNPGPLSNPWANQRNPFPYNVDPKNAVYDLPASIGSAVSGKNLDAMYNQNVSLLVERQLSRDWMVQLGYVGNLGRKLVNQAEGDPAVYIPGTDSKGNVLSTTKNTDQRRLLAPLFRGFNVFSSDANSSYHGLQTMAMKRFSNSFSVIAHYTWAKGIDDSCTNEGVSCRQQDPFNRAASRGLNDFDKRHVAVVSYVYELPVLRSSQHPVARALGGWRIAGMNSIRSGGHFSISTGTDQSLTGVGFDRPDVAGKPELSGDRPKSDRIAKWFDTAAFVRNQVGQFGNSGRNVVLGPGEFNWDISLQKRFRAGSEKRSVEFRSDFFNVLNHANLGNPATTLSSPQSFGRITSSGPGRVTQFVLRYQF